MRDLFFINAVNEIPSMLFLIERAFVLSRSHDEGPRIGVRGDG